VTTVSEHGPLSRQSFPETTADESRVFHKSRFLPFGRNDKPKEEI